MLGPCLDRVRQTGPLIHNITNYVTANDVANLLLACGARPIMADEPEEAAEITARCDGLHLNLGTPSRRTIPSLFSAGARANHLGRPVVLDPVGVGASAFRIRTARQLLGRVRMTAVRGNVSEIRALAAAHSCQGVDASAGDAVTEGNLTQSIALFRSLSRQLGAIVAVTGEIDLITDGGACYLIRNGRPEMGRVTGTGCQLSALTAAFLAANPDRPLEAVCAAVCAMGLAGEIAFARLGERDGNIAYRGYLIDAICRMDADTLEKGAKIERR